MTLQTLAAVLLILAQKAPVVDADFPGGNLILEKVDGDTVYIRQDPRDTRGFWFYWSFRVREAAGRTLTFTFTGRNVLGVRGPAVSADGGRTWAWLGKESVKGQSFRYAFGEGAEDVRFCFAMPYQEADLKRFLEGHRGNPALKVSTLCTTKKKRDVERISLGRLDGKAAHRVLLTARHHSCEMMASYVVEGIMAEALSDSEDGAWLRENVEFFIVPFMDKDGVEDGDQGKNRRPRDHNRDYVGEPLYASTRALRERIPAWSKGGLSFALDLHCPYISGQHNETVYFVGGQDEKIWGEVQAFSTLLEEKTRKGPIAYRAKNNLPFGKGWNTNRNYKDGKSFSRWASELPGTRFASTLEVAYANADGAPVTPESARALGRDLASALARYLQK